MESLETLIFRDSNPVERQDKTNRFIKEPYAYLLGLTPNNASVRHALVATFNQMYFNVQNHQIVEGIAHICEVLHDCSLLVDDIEDSSEYRRGAVTAHLHYGVPITINCVNYMYFEVFRYSEQLPKMFTENHQQQQQLGKQITDILIDEMLNLHHGQGIEIYWRDRKHQLEQLPTEDQYLEMVMDKTGGLFRIISKLLNVFLPSKSDKYVAVSNIIGIIYQLRDDYYNLTNEKYEKAKGTFGEDLVEGKFSFPILHSLWVDYDRGNSLLVVHELLYKTTLEYRKENPQVVRTAAEYLINTTNSLEHTKLKLLQCFVLACALVEKDSTVEDGSLMFQILDKLSI